MILISNIKPIDMTFLIPIIISFILSILLAFWNLYQHLRIENLKSDAEKQLHVYRLQFEKEFGIYDELWSKLVSLRKTITGLRPEMDSFGPNISYDEILKIRLDGAVLIWNDIIDSIEQNKPFYSQTVYLEFSKIRKLVRSELLDFKNGDSKTIEYWENGKQNREELLKLTEIVCEAIRDRIGNLEVK